MFSNENKINYIKIKKKSKKICKVERITVAKIEINNRI